MRSLASLTLLGTLVLAGAVSAQSLAEHAAAAAGATIGTAGGKPLSNALGKVFGDVDKTTANAAGVKPKTAVPAKTTEAETKSTSEKASPLGASKAPAPTSAGPVMTGGGGSGAVASRGSARSSRARQTAEVPLAPIAPPVAEPVVPVAPVKELSAADFSGVQVGATEKDMLAALGVPESRTSIPDDDGHLRETCQYWAQGRQLGTVRLDNGQVVQVLVRNQ